MARSIDARLRALSRVLGWSLTTLKDDRGRVVQVHSLTLIDAFLRVQLRGPAALELDPDLSHFLSTYHPLARDGALLETLRWAARQVWFPNEANDAND